MAINRRVFHMASPVLPKGLGQHLSDPNVGGTIIIGEGAGDAGLGRLLEIAIPHRPVYRDTVIFAAQVEPMTVAPMRAIFAEVIANPEYRLLAEADLVAGCRAPDADDLAVGVAYSAGVRLLTFLAGDRMRLVVKADAIAKDPEMGEPDHRAVALADRGRIVTFGASYRVAFQVIRFAHDPLYQKKARHRAREHDQSFGACLRRARIHKGIGQGDFIGIGDQTIRRIELGIVSEAGIHRKTRELIEHHLGMTFDKIKGY